MPYQAIVCLQDFEDVAASKLPKTAFDYYRGGADNQITCAENLAAFKRWQIRPRVLRDVSKISTGATILGHHISSPICVAPSALHGMAHPEAETGSAYGSFLSDVPFTLATYANTSIEDIASKVPGHTLFFQLYYNPSSEINLSFIKRIEESGFKAIVLTVDLPVRNKRRDEDRNRFTVPSSLRFANFDQSSEGSSDFAPNPSDPDSWLPASMWTSKSLNWEGIKWLKSVSKLPLIVKGILTGEDAELAAEYGVDGIIVSNHGGRQLDTVSATIDVLPEIVTAVAGRCEVYMDGGVRCGADVFKALALGATAVFVGRPIVFALAYNGAAGVKQALDILKEEFKSTLALAGCSNIGDISPEMVVHRSQLLNRYLPSRQTTCVSVLNKTSIILDHPLVCLEDFEKFAASRLPKQALDYYRSGAGDEITLADNQAAFTRLTIRPRFLRDVSQVVTDTTILGHHVPWPICVAPTAMQRMAHHDGEVGSAYGSYMAQIPFTLSTIATSSIEEVAAKVPTHLLFFQMYIYKNRNLTLNLLRRAEANGFKAVLLTVDTPFFGKRHADDRNRFALPPHLRMANFDQFDDFSNKGVSKSKKESGLAEYSKGLFDPSLTWDDVKWLKSITKLPVVLKGILTGEDAVLAVECGVNGILVSNHGARQLDTVPATIDVLPEVVKAVAGRCEVYLDGGVRCGTDVFKALALGARAVFIGRPVIYALTYNGADGVKEALDILKTEFKTTMSLAGCVTVNDICHAMVSHPSHFPSAKL